MKWSKKVLVVFVILVLCFASFSSVFFGKNEKVEPAKATTATVSYNRDAAANFAANYWNKVCPDGFYSLVDYKTSDCAHFVSYALSYAYGQLNNDGRDYIPDTNLCSRQYKGFTRSQDLSIWLYNKGYVKDSDIFRVYVYDSTYGDPNWRDTIRNFLYSHQGDQYKGDVIFFVYNNPGDRYGPAPSSWNGHTALYLGIYDVNSHGGIAQHSWGGNYYINTWAYYDSEKEVWQCANRSGTYGYGSYDDYRKGPVGFIDYMASQKNIFVNRFVYYHINTATSNQPPILSSGSVFPTSGTTSTTFTYTVHYSDPDGDSPTTKYVYIDDNPHTMSLQSGSPSDGTYYYSTTLSPGSHNYYFKFNDGHGHEKTTTTYSGPTVSTPEKPDLIVEDIWVDPDPPTAGGSTTVWFKIKNQGAGDATETFYSHLHFDDVYKYYVTTDGLTAGHSETYYWDMTWPSDSNQHTVKVIVDVSNVIPESDNSNNDLSKSFSATPSCTPPNAPSLSSPYNGQTGVSLTPTLSWNSPTSGTTPFTYTVQVSTSSSFSSYIINQSGISSTSYPVPSGKLTYNTPYYWRVQAHNSCGGATSTVYHFTTLSPPLTVNVTGPSSGQVNTNYTFTANASGGTGSYTYSWSSNGLVSHSGNTATYKWSSSGAKTVTCTVTSGSQTKSDSATISISEPPDFTISASPSSQSVTQGNSTTYTINLTSQNGFNSSVSLSSSGLPSGANASFNPQPVTPTGSSTLTISTSSSTPTGSHTITITASGGGKTHQTSVTLVVNSSITSPTVSTNSASNITSTSATLNGDLTDMGGDSSVTVYFQWGTSTSYGNTTTQQTKSSTGTFSANLSNLSSNTTYHYRAVATNSAGTSYGDDKTFTTITNEAYEPDDDSSHATLISTDGTIQTHNFGTQGDVDWIKFNAVEGKTYTIQTLNLGSDCDTVMYLYAPDGTTAIDYNDDFGSLASRIDFECPQGKGGTYYIKIKHWNSDAFGPDTNYDIRVYPAIKISFSDSDNGNKEFGIAGQDNNVTVTVTQGGNPVSGASVYCSFTGTTQTTNTNGQVTLNINPSWGGNVYFEVTKGDYAYCYRYFWLLNSNDSLIKAKPKDANGYYLTNYDLRSNPSNGGWWDIYSSYHNTTYVMTWSNNSVVEVVKLDWDSGDDIAYYMVKSATTTPGAITNVPFDASTETVSFTISAQLDGNPLTNAEVILNDSDFNYTGELTEGYTDSSGSQTIYATPGTYTVILVQDNWNGNPDVVLMDTGINVASGTTHTVSYTSSQLGTLNRHAYDGNNNEIKHYLTGSINNYCYFSTSSTGEPMLLIPGTYQWKWEERGEILDPDWSNRWDYDFIPTETTTISAGETQEIDFGGPLTTNINFDKSSYNPGDKVNIKVPITDHYGHYLDRIYHYSYSSGSASPGSGNYGGFHSPHKVNNPYYPNNNVNDNMPEQKLYENEVNARIISPNYVQPSSWEYPYIHLVVKDPSNATVVDTSDYSFWYLRERGYNYTLPSDAPTGTYTVTVTLDTGPYQGTVTKEDTFTVSSSASLTIHLKGNKFNLVSFPFTVNPSDIPNLVKAYSFDWSDYWQVWTPNGDQDFTTFKPGKGYWIKVSEDEDIPLTGTPASASNSDVIAPSGAQYGMSITQPANGSTVTTTSLQVSGTFDTAQPAGYEVILTVTANSQSHQYTYTLPNTQSTWGPITVPASDFDLTTGNSYSAALEAILQDSNGIPVGPPGIDSGTVNFTWKPSSSFPVTITPGKFNLLGVPFNSSIDISALNSANGNHILKIYSFDWTNYWQLWTPNGEQDFTTLEPGKGYWILFDSTASPTFEFVLP